MGVLPFAEVSLDDLAVRDEAAANEFDMAARR